MDAISLTTFVDFIGRSGTPKMTVVRDWKHRGKYDPTTDYWKRLRDGIVAVQSKGRALSTLDTIVDAVPSSKATNYRAVAKAYKKWSKGLNATWFNPTKRNWVSGAIAVQVNPELGLTFNGNRHLVKLYFRDAPLPKNRADLILHMMHVACGGTAKQGTLMALLDVRKAKLHTSSGPVKAHGAQLAGEAAYWAAVFPQV